MKDQSEIDRLDIQIDVYQDDEYFTDTFSLYVLDLELNNCEYCERDHGKPHYLWLSIHFSDDNSQLSEGHIESWYDAIVEGINKALNK